MTNGPLSEYEYQRRQRLLAEEFGEDEIRKLLKRIVAEQRSADNVSAWFGRKRVHFLSALGGIAVAWAALGPFSDIFKGWFR